mmetsp:Transcript_5112/g.16351  ORF Transcript_5112/g.16351 Transcript_5112/m.16351 type:complete len:119 (-) Transcript_5112:596-952(-)
MPRLGVTRARKRETVSSSTETRRRRKSERERKGAFYLLLCRFSLKKKGKICLNMYNADHRLHGFSLKGRTTDKRGMIFRQRVDVIQRSDQRALSDVFHAVFALDVVESLSLLRARKTD